MRVLGWKTPVRNESDSGWNVVAQSAGLNPSGERSECEHTCWDPKDGELCLSISNPLKRHPFSGLVHSAGELLHTP